MRLSIFVSTLLTISLAVGVRAAESGAAPAGKPVFTLPEVEVQPAASAFSDTQVAAVLAWIREAAPECPAGAAAAAAENFLSDLQLHHPEELDRLPRADFPAPEFASTLLRAVGAQLTGARQAALRETVAAHRIEVLLAAQGAARPGSPGVGTAAIARIKGLSPVFHRRLIEGKMEDDELLRLCMQTRETGAERKAAVVAPAKPKVLTAAEIAAEFLLHNQTGPALARLRAYSVEAQLKTAAGEEQQLFLYKLRPDRFRLLVRANGVGLYVAACDGEHYWRQVPGKAPEQLTRESVGVLRHLGEFLGPLFEPEGYRLERLEDGLVGDRKCFRIAVKRADGTGYVAALDQENFHELGRENEDGSRVRYSDFRDFAGLTISHREDDTYSDGRKGTLEITRVVANPGLIQAFFEPPSPQEFDFFALDRVIALATVPGAAPQKQ